MKRLESRPLLRSTRPEVAGDHSKHQARDVPDVAEFPGGIEDTNAKPSDHDRHGQRVDLQVVLRILEALPKQTLEMYPRHHRVILSCTTRDKGKSVKNACTVGCIQCHRVEGRGGSVGPDLSSAGNRFGRRELLESIIEPQKVVSDQYAIVPMPAGLADSLSSEELRDLIGWLATRAR